MKIESHLEGFDSMVASVRAQADLRDEILDAIHSSLKVGEQSMQLLVPRKSGDLAETIRINMQPNIVQGNVRQSYAPGAAGGGGFYQGELLVGDETTDYLEALTEGTGIYGPLGGRIFATIGNVAPRANIGMKVASRRKIFDPETGLHFGNLTPQNYWHKRSNAHVMQWYRDGQEFFRKSIAGQKPQREWIDASRRDADRTLARKIREIDISAKR